jgi:TnpA family transposase
MEVEKNYGDTHRQSEVSFAFCYLLGFELLPRLKHLKKQRLYRPHKQGEGEPYVNVQAILTRPIAWELIEAQFDAMIKFATALRLGQRTRNPYGTFMLDISKRLPLEQAA